MHFFIITPTYNRLSQLQRNIQSVQGQDFRNFTHYIIDDSTKNDTEEWFSKSHFINTIYLKNEKNFWSNFSKNRALDTLFSGEIPWDSYLIFLDDDDYLFPNALRDLKLAIESNEKYNWYLSRRVYPNGVSITQVQKGEWVYRYVNDYLLWVLISGDATHIIATKRIQNIRFPLDIKNWEEWIFFLQIAKENDIYFLDLTSTLTDWYAADWLTLNSLDIWFRKKMFVRMYKILGSDFPHIRRWKIILGYIYYIPGIWHVASLFK